MGAPQEGGNRARHHSYSRTSRTSPLPRPPAPRALVALVLLQRALCDTLACWGLSAAWGATASVLARSAERAGEDKLLR